jgi:RNA polymerase sigma-70 factor (ECF subfamily)
VRFLVTSYAMVCVPDTNAPTDTTKAPRAELSDEQLMARIRKRDQAAFSCLLNRHLNAIHAYLFRLTGSRTDADDLSQDTFLRVWRKAASFKPGRAKLTTWLHRIAHNLFVDEYRRQLRAQPPNHAVDTDPALDEIADPRADHASLSEHREQLADLNRALMALPEGQRSALTLCQIQGFSNLEAADIMAVSVRALESLLARARRRLKNELSEHTT